jgi:hypothetical protein
MQSLRVSTVPLDNMDQQRLLVRCEFTSKRPSGKDLRISGAHGCYRPSRAALRAYSQSILVVCVRKSDSRGDDIHRKFCHPFSRQHSRTLVELYSADDSQFRHEFRNQLRHQARLALAPALTPSARPGLFFGQTNKTIYISLSSSGGLEMKFTVSFKDPLSARRRILRLVDLVNDTKLEPNDPRNVMLMEARSIATQSLRDFDSGKVKEAWDAFLFVLGITFGAAFLNQKAIDAIFE